MKKKLFLLIGLALTILLIVWEFYLFPNFKENIVEWGDYFFIIPMIFCYAAFFLRPEKVNPLSIICGSAFGVITSIALGIHFSDYIWVYKICATIVGALVTWSITRKLKYSKEI